MFRAAARLLDPSRRLTTSSVTRTTIQFRLRRKGSTPAFQQSSSRTWSSSSESSSAKEGSSDDDSRLYMWGTDTKGSLLKPPDRQSETVLDVPQRIADWRSTWSSGGTPVPPNTIIRKVVCGATDTAWLLSDGSCWVAGENKYGQLGQGHSDPVRTPVPLLNLPMEDPTTTTIVDISLGPSMAAVVDSAGDLYTCGFGGSTFSGMGMLGHGTGDSLREFALVASLVEDGCTVQQVQVGESHTTVLTTEGEVLTTGAGSYGRLGNFDTLDQLYFEPVEVLTSGVVSIAGGKSFTLALHQDGVVYGWGRNHKGQLGTGLGLAVDMYAMQAVPEPIQADELLGRRVTRIAAGHSHAACITQGGELFYWGMSLHLEPVRVNDLLHTQVVDVACGKDYTLALDVGGKLYSFGKGKNGCLGQGNVKQVHQATWMEAFGNSKVTRPSAGWDHAACLVQEAA